MTNDFNFSYDLEDAPFMVDPNLFQDGYNNFNCLGQKARMHELASKMSTYFKGRYQDTTRFTRCFLAIDVFASGDDFADEEDNSYVRIDSEMFGFEAAQAMLTDAAKLISTGKAITDSQGYVYKLSSVTESDGYTILVHYQDGTFEPFSIIVTDDFVEMRMFICDVTKTHYMYFPDLIADLVDNQETMSAYSDAIDAVINGVDNAGLQNVLAGYLSSGRSAVVQTVNDLLNTISSTGLFGVLTYLSSVAKGASTFTWSVDAGNRLIITDNDSLMPQQYMAGILDTTENSPITITSLIVAIINPVVGLVTYVAGNLIRLGLKKLNYDFDTETVAQINDNGNVPFFPAFCSRYLASTNLISTAAAWPQSAVKYGESNTPFIFHFGPCVYVISTLASPDVNGNRTCIEGHLDLCDRSQAILSFLDNYFLLATPTSSSDDTAYVCTWSNVQNLGQEIRGLVRATANTIITNDPSTGVLSESGDRKLRIVVQTNLLLNVLFNTFSTGIPTGAYSRWEFGHTQNATISPFSFNGIHESTWSTSSNPSARKGFAKLFYNTILYSKTFTDSYILSWSDILSIMSMFELLQSSGSSYTGYRQVTLVDYELNDTTKTVAIVGLGGNLISHQADDQFSVNPLYHTVQQIVTKGNYILNLPKYDRNTFFDAIKSIVALAVVTTVVFSVFAVISKTILNKWAATRSITAERLWARAVSNPDREDYLQEYRSFAFKNNVISRIFGGTRYSRMGFWSGGSLAQAKLTGYAQAFLSGGAAGVLTSHILGDEANSAKEIKNFIKSVIVGD